MIFTNEKKKFFLMVNWFEIELNFTNFHDQKYIA